MARPVANNAPALIPLEPSLRLPGGDCGRQVRCSAHRSRADRVEAKRVRAVQPRPLGVVRTRADHLGRRIGAVGRKWQRWQQIRKRCICGSLRGCEEPGAFWQRQHTRRESMQPRDLRLVVLAAVCPARPAAPPGLKYLLEGVSNIHMTLCK